MKVIKEIFSGVSLAAILLLFVFAVSFAWTNPTQSPPGGGGVLRTDQDKNVGISTDTSFDPEFRLDVDAGGAANSGFRATGISTFVDKLGIGLDKAADVKEKLHLSDGNFLQNNPAHPKVVAGYTTLKNPLLPNNALHVAVSGKYAYVIFAGTGENAFRVINITDPKNPKIVGGNDITGLPTCNNCHPSDISVSGKYAYVIFNGSQSNAFRVIDISDPSNPKVLGGANLTNLMPLNALSALFSSGRYVYVAFNGTGSNAFRIIDVSDPLQPYVVGGHTLTSTDIPSVPQPGIYAEGRYVYLNLACSVGTNCTTGTNSFKVIDVLDPKNPTVVGATVSGTLPDKMFAKLHVSGGYAYVSLQASTPTGIGAMGVLDISDPRNPKFIGTLSYAPGITIPTFNPFAISGAGNYIYLGFFGASSQALRIVNVSDPTNPVAVGGHDLGDMAEVNSDIYVAGRYIYMTFDTPNDLNNKVFRIIDPTGIEAVSGSIHSLETGSFIVKEKASIGSNLDVKGGLNVGGSILNAGGIAIGGDLFIKIPDSLGVVKTGGIRLFVKETSNTASQSCDVACGSGPTSCLSAFNSLGNNVACSVVALPTSPGRCLCSFFGSGIIPK